MKVKSFEDVIKAGIYKGYRKPIINRVWAMPNRWTFKIKPIKELIDRHLWGHSCDPFAGQNSPARITNDLTEDAVFNMDALDFLKTQKNSEYDTVLYDPPYSITQARKYGAKKYASMKYWADCKNEIARITNKKGTVTCCGWSSNGMGKGRGFEMVEILLVPHGGSKNDTIITVEYKDKGAN